MSQDNVFVGFVVKMITKEGVGKRGPWTAYSVKVADKEGNEFPQWFGLGFKAPTCKEGDYVKLTCSEVNDKSAKVESVKVSNNPPARKMPAKPAGGGSGGGKSDYSSDAARADRAYHAARGSAIDLVAVLLEHKALPTSSAQTKAGAAARYEEIVAAVDKMTVKYFRDEFPTLEGEFRLFKEVADAGNIAKEVPEDVPDRDEEPQALEGKLMPADEFPPEEDDDGF